jgi:hypothetical protein
VSDRTPSFSVCAFAVELGPHHGTRICCPCSATNTRIIPPSRAGHGTFTTKHFLFRLQIKESRHGEDFKPGALLGSVSGELGLRKYLELNGHTFVVTADKDGPGSVFERELPDADVVISQPFWPAI